MIVRQDVEAAETMVEVGVGEVTVERVGEKRSQRVPLGGRQLMGMTKPHPVSGCGFGGCFVVQCFSGPTWYSKTSPATVPMIATTRAIANQKFAVAKPIAKSVALAAMAIGQ